MATITTTRSKPVAGPASGKPEGKPLDSEIAAEAYTLFEARGFEHGHDVDDWLAAEALLRQRRISRRAALGALERGGR